MTTPYCSKNQAFSDAAHAAAESTVYPAIFPDCEIQYEVQSVDAGGDGLINDGEKAIDYILRVVPQSDWYAGKSLVFTVQERWRRRFTKDGFDVMSANDITITSSNPTGQRSEFEKMQCQWMLYGFYCEKTQKILRADWADISAIRFKAVTGEWGYEFDMPKANGRSYQRFSSVPRSLPEVLPITPLAAPSERTS